MTKVILDISRLISRVRYSTPSGVDRVEMAYARGLLGFYGDALEFSAVHPVGLYGRISRQNALAYLDELERRWSREDGHPRQRSIVSIIPWLIALLPSYRGCGKGGVYVQASPHHLTNTPKVRKILRLERAKFLCLVHDLIPIEFPEYARPSGAALHLRRIETIAKLADAAVVNSAATGRSLQPWIDRFGRDIPVHVALLGTEQLTDAWPGASDERPYFVCVGTIEPRKNHLLLLNLWRHFSETLPSNEIPRLVIIGRRGWENEQIVDMLERCVGLGGHVEELGGCSDSRMVALLRGARALLMPSFAEGYGMPVAEALSVGTPVICSNLPALQEVGGSVPDYLEPLDGLGWKSAILDYADQGEKYKAQMVRLPSWHCQSWEEHIEILIKAIEQLR